MQGEKNQEQEGTSSLSVRNLSEEKRELQKSTGGG